MRLLSFLLFLHFLLLLLHFHRKPLVCFAAAEIAAVSDSQQITASAKEHEYDYEYECECLSVSISIYDNSHCESFGAQCSREEMNAQLGEHKILEAVLSLNLKVIADSAI